MSQTLNNLLTLLNLEKIEEGLFRGQSEDLGLRQVFGGQVVGRRSMPPKKRCRKRDWYIHSTVIFCGQATAKNPLSMT